MVHWEFNHPTATAVAIAGTFNDWRPEVTEMVAVGDGCWRKEIVLPPGTYEYLFVADDEWISAALHLRLNEALQFSTMQPSGFTPGHVNTNLVNARRRERAPKRAPTEYTRVSSSTWRNAKRGEPGALRGRGRSRPGQPSGGTRK